MTTVVYVVGPTHCGSTVLGNLIGERPGHVSAGELRMAWRRWLQPDARCGGRIGGGGHEQGARGCSAARAGAGRAAGAHLVRDSRGVLASHRRRGSLDGNRNRFVTGTLELAEDLRWRAELNRADRALALALTGPLLARYGYLPRTASSSSSWVLDTI